MSQLSPAHIILYWTNFAATLKVRSDITKIKHILDSKKIQYEDVDLSEQPHRRVDMLKYSDNNHTLPQLHVNNRFIGSADDIQELEDWGELQAILRGVSPGKLAAESAAAAQAEAVAYSASLAAAGVPATLPQPSFSPPSSPPQLDTTDQQQEEQEEQEEVSLLAAEEICTPIQKIENREDSPRTETEELEQNTQEEEQEEVQEKDDVELPCLLDLEEEQINPIIEKKEENEVEEEESSLDYLLPNVTAEESCYFSPIVHKPDSQKEQEEEEEEEEEEDEEEEEQEKEEDKDYLKGTLGDVCTTTLHQQQPELVIVQANLQDLDLESQSSFEYKQDQHSEYSPSPSPSPGLSSITPAPSPAPLLLEEEESEPALDFEVTLQDKTQSQSQNQSPSGRTLLEHPLGDAVHAHAVPLDLDPAPSTTEDEEFIIIDTLNTNFTLEDINSPEEEEE